MSIPHRMAELFKVKAHAALDRAEDPRELLDHANALQRDLLADVRRGVVDVAAARKRAEQRAAELRDSAARLAEQAEKVLAAGHQDLAREALTERGRILGRADALEERASALRGEEERLTAAADRLKEKVEAFSHQREVLKAQYTLSEAETYVNETVAGISDDAAGAGARRAEDQAAETHARAGALDELLESGALREPLLDVEQEPVQPHLRARLDDALTGAAVDDELDRMKARLHDEGPQRPPAE